MDTCGTDDFGLILARFARGLSPAKLPPAALAAARTNVFDTLACAVAGSGAPAVAEARSLAGEWGGAPQATLLGFGERVPAHHAAWVNGTMAHARDYDGIHDAAVLHAGVAVVPAALAAAELAGGASGADFLSGVAAGLETVCRLGLSTRISIIDSGFIYSPLFGYFGATVAAARVLGLSEAQTVDALGIAYSQAAGNHQVTRDAALTKRMQPGFAAMGALLAVQLARRGVGGSPAVFDGADGFLRVYLHGQCDAHALREGLGRRFQFTQLSYKPYPCCRFNHTAIQAALALRESADRKVKAMRRIRVGLNRQAYEAVCTPIDMRKAPRTTVQAQFSLPYTVAAALADGCVRLAHFTDAALERTDLLLLASKLEPYVDDSIERDFARNMSPAAVELEMEDGTRHGLRIDAPLGHPNRPMLLRDFDAKALDCFEAAARPLREGAHRRLRLLVDQLEKLEDVRSVLEVLTPCP